MLCRDVRYTVQNNTAKGGTMIKALLTVLAMLLLPSLLGQGRGTPYFEHVGKQALAELKCNWQAVLTNWKIVFQPGRPGYLGLYDPKIKLITIWVRQNATPHQVAAVIAHELGHIIDGVTLGPQEKAEWRKLRSIPETVPWYPKDLKSDYATPAGDFAACVAWTIQGPGQLFKGKLGSPPNAEQQKAIRRWLEQTITAGM